MSLVLPPPVLAADFGTLLSIVFVVIAVLSWISNALSSTGNSRPANRPADGPRPARPARPRDERLQDEIDIFLQEVGGKRPENAQRTKVEPVEVVEFEDAIEPAPVVAVAESEGDRSARGRRPPVSTIAERSLVGPEELGNGVKSHVAQSMQDRVGAEVQQHLGHTIDASVSEHLGQFTAQSLASTSNEIVPGTISGSPITQPAITMLKNPDGVRQAIMLSEILAPPLAKRQ